MTTKPIRFDHEKLSVYQRSLKFITWPTELLERVPPRLSVYSQLDRASTSTRLLRSPLDGRHTVAVEASFPLTLTLSLGEREQQPPGVCSAHSGLGNSVVSISERRRTILPLPKGEGRGEGEYSVAYPAVHGLNAADQEKDYE